MNSQQHERQVALRRLNPSNKIRVHPRQHLHRTACVAVQVSASNNSFSRIYALTRKIPRGKVATYGQIARALGMPRGARTVGWAMHDCPDGSTSLTTGSVPWHRVVNAQGKISARPTLGFIAQRARLKAEGVRFDREGKIDLKKFGWRRI